jgi:hypothetical protein
MAKNAQLRDHWALWWETAAIAGGGGPHEISHLKRFLQDLCLKMGGIDAVRAITGHEREGNCARQQHRGDGIDRGAAQIYVEKREIERTAAGSHDGIVIQSPRRRAREWIAG